MNEPFCDATCGHYHICARRMQIQAAFPTDKAAAVVLNREGRRGKLDHDNATCSSDLASRVSGWLGKWCPDREVKTGGSLEA